MNFLQLMLLPESFLSISICILLLIGTIYSTSLKKTDLILSRPFIIASAVSLFICAILSLCQSESHIIFFGQIMIDPFTSFIKSFILFISGIVLLSSLNFLKFEKINAYEYSIIYLISILGMLVIVSSNTFLSLYLGIELQALSFYVLTSFKRNEEASTEAGLKYFVFSSFASGIILFGISLMYTILGSVDFYTISCLNLFNLNLNDTSYNIIYISLILILSGFFFKIYAAPFHLWVPDVYQGSPTSVTMLFSTVPYITMSGLFVRFLKIDLLSFQIMQNVFIVISIASLIIGSIAAIYQKNIKRFLAYSSIANAGYISISIASPVLQQFDRTIFFMLIYSITMLSLFTIIISIRRLDNLKLINYLNQFSMIYKQNSSLAITIALVFFSMAGIPPLVGFFSKLYVFHGLVEGGLIQPLIIIVLVSGVSAFYYLRCIKIIFFESSITWSSFIKLNSINAYVISCSVILLLIAFLYPNLLITFIKYAII